MDNKKSITMEDVESVAKLARLEFSEDEKEKFVHDFNNIIGYVEKLQEVDTENVDISTSAFKMFNELREDEVQPSMDREDIMKNAPDSIEGFIKVPTIIE